MLPVPWLSDLLGNWNAKVHFVWHQYRNYFAFDYLNKGSFMNYTPILLYWISFSWFIFTVATVITTNCNHNLINFEQKFTCFELSKIDLAFASLPPTNSPWIRHLWITDNSNGVWSIMIINWTWLNSMEKVQFYTCILVSLWNFCFSMRINAQVSFRMNREEERLTHGQ